MINWPSRCRCEMMTPTIKFLTGKQCIDFSVDEAEFIDTGTSSSSDARLLKAAAVGDLDVVEAALKEGANVNAAYNESSMGDMLKPDDLEVKEAQLRQQMVTDPDYVYTVSEWEPLPFHATALILASRAGHVEVVKRLLSEAEIDCNRSTIERLNVVRSNQTALHWACRHGNLGVVQALIADARVNVNAFTRFGITPFGLAVQQGHLKVVNEMLACSRFQPVYNPPAEVRKMYAWLGLNWDKFEHEDSCLGAFQLIFNGGSENRLEVVERCLQDERIRRFFSDPEVRRWLPPALSPVSSAVTFEHSPEMLTLWLKHGGDPNSRLLDGSYPLDHAVTNNRVHHMRVLLHYEAKSTVLTPMRRAQVLGDAERLRELALSSPSQLNRESLPRLHQIVLQGDDEVVLAEVRKEMATLGDARAVRDCMDEGKLPAAFYAIELGHFSVARELLAWAYGFPGSLVDKLIKACEGANTALPGDRSYWACYTLIEQDAIELEETRVAALAFLKPWCSSLVAVRALGTAERFAKFSNVCKLKNSTFYKRVDARVTREALHRAAAIGADISTGAYVARQDCDNVVPPIKFYRDYSKRAALSFHHEGGVAQAYAYLGHALAKVFERDVHEVFSRTSVRTVLAAPKAYQRMFNKLMNPAEHGGEQIPRPRCAKNVDILRGCVVAKDVLGLETAFAKLCDAFTVVRVKNTHSPDVEGYEGGYRSILINFLYEPGITWAQLFGGVVTFDISNSARAGIKRPTVLDENPPHVAQLWNDYVDRGSSLLDLMALEGLQILSSEHAEKPVRMIAELQLVLEPYFEGRAVSHLLFKVARCDTGAMEMVRDFYQEYYQKEGQDCARALAVQDIALAIREGRPLPPRADTEMAVVQRARECATTFKILSGIVLNRWEVASRS